MVSSSHSKLPKVSLMQILNLEKTRRFFFPFFSKDFPVLKGLLERSSYAYASAHLFSLVLSGIASDFRFAQSLHFGSSSMGGTARASSSLLSSSLVDESIDVTTNDITTSPTSN